MGTGNVPFIRPHSHACLLGQGESHEGEKLAGLGAEGAKGASCPQRALPRCPVCYISTGISNIPRTVGEGPREALAGRKKTEREVARATKFPWVLEMGGFLPSPHPICL